MVGLAYQSGLCVMADLLLLGLATWRISHLLVAEDGPWDLIARIRALIGVSYNERSEPEGSNMLARAFTCVWCLSIWIGLVLAGAFLYSPDIGKIIALPFALSGIAALVEGYLFGQS